VQIVKERVRLLLSNATNTLSLKDRDGNTLSSVTLNSGYTGSVTVITSVDFGTITTASSTLNISNGLIKCHIRNCINNQNIIWYNIA
jgi:hypothetical protein